jgi:hypothetical protein
VLDQLNPAAGKTFQGAPGGKKNKKKNKMDDDDGDGENANAPDQ